MTRPEGGIQPGHQPHHRHAQRPRRARVAGRPSQKKGWQADILGRLQPPLPTLAKPSQVRAPFLHPQLFLAPFGSSPPTFPPSTFDLLSSPPDSLGFLPTPAPRSPQPRRLRPAPSLPLARRRSAPRSSPPRSPPPPAPIWAALPPDPVPRRCGFPWFCSPVGACVRLTVAVLLLVAFRGFLAVGEFPAPQGR